MADLLLSRVKTGEGSTLGHLHTLPAPGFLCWTLENPIGSNRPNIDAIPAGEWPLRLRGEGGYKERYAGTEQKRGRFGWYVDGELKGGWHKEMVEIVVPERTFILFHVGNHVKDTMGCVLVGETHGEQDGDYVVWSSAKAYTRIYPAIYKAAERGGSILVTDPG